MTRECAQPVTDQALLDWWVGELPTGERGPTERHLLGCSSCSWRAEILHSLSEGVRALVRGGRLNAVVTEALVERMRGEGRKIREYRVEAGGSVQCTVAPDDEMLITRFEAAVGEGPRVDLLIRIGDAPEMRLPDLPCPAGSREVVMAFPVDILQSAPAHVEYLRLVAVDGAGERLLGEYTFNHTPWPGRPDASA